MLPSHFKTSYTMWYQCYLWNVNAIYVEMERSRVQAPAWTYVLEQSPLSTLLLYTQVLIGYPVGRRGACAHL